MIGLYYYYNNYKYMNKKLFITNNVKFHYEVVESVIVKCKEILKISKDTPLDIYLHVNNNQSFKKYIANKYPNIKLKKITNYDYYINCTIYDKDFKNLNKSKSNKKYISHEITDRLRKNPNVFFLTPLSKSNYIYADVLPYANEKKMSDTPIYIIQGNLNQGRRNINLLVKILENSYKYKFIIKLIGKGYLPRELSKFKDKIVLKKNLNFCDYHKEFIDAYCILPLISKNTHKQYYTKKLTSSISYALGYKLKCLIDNDLQKIYNLGNVEIYNNANDIVKGFTRTLEQFYNK